METSTSRRNYLALGIIIAMLLGGCQSAYYGTMEKLGYEKRDLLVDNVQDARKAQEWLGREFEVAGCVPTNPVGKLLLADKILCLAKTQKDAAYAEPTPWVQSFVRAAATAIGRAVLTIDLGNHSLGY